MNLALFDFDGTITFKDTFVGFLLHAVDPARVRRGAILLAPEFVGYKLGLVRGATLRSKVAKLGFEGVNASTLQRAGEDYARRIIPQLVRPYALERIRWHKAMGDTVVVVSASLDVYLTPWCREAEVELISTELESDHGVLTGRYRRGDCSRAEKAIRVRERFRLRDYQTIYAYGDTPEDKDLLELAHRRYYRWRELTTTPSRPRFGSSSRS